MFKNMFKTSIAIISILILISTIYSATIITLDYLDGNNTKPVEPRGDLGMRGFHEPSPEIRKSELELEKKIIQKDIKKQISKIDSMIENIENNNYESLKKELELQRIDLENDQELDIQRIELEILRMSSEFMKD